MWNKIKNFVLDWIWQLPQNLCGLIYKLCIWEDIKEAIPCQNAQIMLKKSNGGVTLGKYVFVYHRYNELGKVVRHELGHVEQSKILGPLYLIVIGLPSIIWAAMHKTIAPKKDYYWFFTEAWANKLAGI